MTLFDRALSKKLLRLTQNKGELDMEEISTTIESIKYFCDSITSTIPSIMLLMGQITAMCSTIAAFWAKPQSGDLLSRAHEIVNALAFNFNEAKNASDA
jgi:hypothetical protein